MSDGDTKGSLKCIGKQAEITGEQANGVIEKIPDISHFIKYISNGLYFFNTKSK